MKIVVMKNVSILGCGWLGKPMAVSLLREGFSVKGSTTSEIKIQELEALEIDAYLIDITEFEEFDLFLASDILLISITSKDIDAYERFIQQLELSSIQKVIFILMESAENGKRIVHAWRALGTQKLHFSGHKIKLKICFELL